MRKERSECMRSSECIDQSEENRGRRGVLPSTLSTVSTITSSGRLRPRAICPTTDNNRSSLLCS